MDRQLLTDQHWDEEMRRKYQGPPLRELAALMHHACEHTANQYGRTVDEYEQFMAWYYYTDPEDAARFDRKAEFYYDYHRPRHVPIFDLKED